MDVFRIAGIAIVTVVLTVTLKNIKPELGMQTAIAGGIILVVLAVSEFTGIADQITKFVKNTGIDGEVLETVFKATGTAYITQSASDICKDAGESALSSKVEICGRVIMASMVIPSFIKVFGTVLQLVGDYL
ncbi:MAG: hypothetical protein K6F68_03300 [Clostridiales bacterium]|nr:hypothetical protein [Clostridiales bacterium]